ncbi:MAG TPA: thiamine pyrophosphate-binding protein [Nitrospira sp.]|nr:thiamine pyrophosphate-binding protein [Nitrospira sp.]
MIKVADYIINTLAERGIDKIFVVYGAANGDLIDAFTRTAATEYVAVMHEQAGGFAAEGYAKVKGIPGVAIATSGPGGMNLLTSMGNCFYDSIPCVFLTGQINSKFLRPDPSIRQVGFQETDIVAMAAPVTKYAKMIVKAEDVRYEVEKALWLCQSGRPGPVLLDIPLDIQKAKIDVKQLVGFEPPAVSGYDLDVVDQQIHKLLDDLRCAERPVILVGGGVRLADAQDDVRELGRRLKIPCFPTWNALDVITSDYEFYGGRIGTYGGAGRNFGIQNSDLLISIGSRISGRITGGNVQSFARQARKYLVEIDPAMVQRKFQQVPFDVNILCDAKTFVRRLLVALDKNPKAIPHRASWTERVMEWKRKYDPVRPEFFKQEARVHPYAFMRRLSEKMGATDVLVGDCGGNIVVSNHAFETKYGQRNLTNNGNSPMGFSFAGAMGAWFADPTRQVVCTIGDGGFNMNLQELQTFLNYGVKVKTFILNNHIYGITKAYQETNFQGRAEACGPKGYRPPNFIKLAQAYGVKTVTIGNHAEMNAKIDEVLQYDEPVVCDVDMDEYHTYEPRIFGWKTPIEDMYPYLSREEFRDNMVVEPVEGWMCPEYPDVVKSMQP